MSAPTRLFALLEHSKITDEARGFFNTTVDFRALEIRCWGARRPPWSLSGVTPNGGSVGHKEFDSMSEAKGTGERFFADAMDGWHEVPAGASEDFISRQLPGYIDWRIGTGPVEDERLFQARLRFAQFINEDDHPHCEFCWSAFELDEDPQPNATNLVYGFVTDDERWVCEPCYHVLRDLLEFDASIE